MAGNTLGRFSCVVDILRHIRFIMGNTREPSDCYKTCDYCEYKAVCGNSERRVSREIPKIRDDEVFDLLEELD
ncbi:MAG: hypothetical protein FWF08_04430 [Oscillospiraceae bacterium]|nr:hypothetical protein [Oscillospiraceae bacterium]